MFASLAEVRQMMDETNDVNEQSEIVSSVEEPISEMKTKKASSAGGSTNYKKEDEEYRC